MAKKLPLAPFGKILKDSAPKIRVSKGATKEFAELLEEMARDLAKDAAEFAGHARRKTIISDDIKLLRKMRNK